MTNKCSSCFHVFNTEEITYSIIDIHGKKWENLCNVCFNTKNSNMVKHKHRYPLRFR